MARPLLQKPSGWLHATLEPDPQLGVIKKVVSGGTPPTTDDENWDGTILWLTPKEISRRASGIFVTETERTISEKGLRSCGASLLPPLSVLLTKRAPVGLVAINSVPMTTNQGFLNFICGERLRPVYLAYWLIANRPYLDAVAIGSTYPELYVGDLFEFEIAVPTLETQDEIIEFMRVFDFVVTSGIPLEQFTHDPSELVMLHAQTRRLADLRTTLLRGLLSGQVSATELPKISKRWVPTNAKEAAVWH
jgi:type I restriction enzyme S subunit